RRGAAAWGALPAPRRAYCRRGGRTGRCRRTRSHTWDSGVRSLTHQVAPFVLGAIEGLVGERHEAVGAGHAVIGERRHADRNGEMERVLPRVGEVVVHHAPPQALDSRYEVQKKLGEGGMSFVYLAREVGSGHDVAIKVLSPKLATDKSSVERLRREAGLAMRLDHPHVCRILRLGESEDGLIYLVMPFLKGELLSDREVRGGPMSLAAGIAILRQVC